MMSKINSKVKNKSTIICADDNKSSILSATPSHQLHKNYGLGINRKIGSAQTESIKLQRKANQKEQISQVY